MSSSPGADKSHLLSALGHEMVNRGRRMKYTSCAMLVQDLLAAKRELCLSREIKKLAKYDGLIIDEMGHVQQSREEMEVLFMLLAERYEHGSVLLTSNLPFSKWEAIFKDPMTTAAAIDRLVHHSIILELNIPELPDGTGPKGTDSSRRTWRTRRVRQRHSLMLAGSPLRPFGATLRPSQRQRHRQVKKKEVLTTIGNFGCR
jgi:hypothetical protein